MSSVKLEDCSQTLELNVNIKDEEVEEKIGKSLSHGRLRLSLSPVTSTVKTNPACLSPSTLSPNLQSLGPDCDSGAQFTLQDPEMASVKLEDCSQTLELNVNIKDEEEEEKIGTSVSHGDHVETFSTSREQQQEDHRAKSSHHLPHYLALLICEPAPNVHLQEPVLRVDSFTNNPSLLQLLVPDCDWSPAPLLPVAMTYLLPLIL
ncbi:uncharacterized protein isoform X6 [Salmo salar]|uniref:Uncharacterized protein isoform X6 n=1 Tax=Salmo salar TaxID=8030 RepID=A0ABM3D1M9_SALSA|nr:uncharacterized protein LOC106598090 isoform X6 [Salmo salar]